jgi:hypothetical protein
MNYLFQVSIGPVQSFIASARRTRDLAFGSWLLSELSKAAALQIAEDNGLESLIFPAPESKESLGPGTSLNVANKIVALVQQSPDTLGQLVHKAVLKRLKGIKEEAYKKVHLTDYSQADAQINDLVEFMWVAYPYDEKKYAEIRQLLEGLMAARKNTRNFAPVTWGSNQPKSSIDGSSKASYPSASFHLEGHLLRKSSGRYIYCTRITERARQNAYPASICLNGTARQPGDHLSQNFAPGSAVLFAASQAYQRSGAGREKVEDLC